MPLIESFYRSPYHLGRQPSVTEIRCLRVEERVPLTIGDMAWQSLTPCFPISPLFGRLLQSIQQPGRCIRYVKVGRVYGDFQYLPATSMVTAPRSNHEATICLDVYSWGQLALRIPDLEPRWVSKVVVPPPSTRLYFQCIWEFLMLFQKVKERVFPTAARIYIQNEEPISSYHPHIRPWVFLSIPEQTFGRQLSPPFKCRMFAGVFASFARAGTPAVLAYPINRDYREAQVHQKLCHLKRIILVEV